MKSTEATKSNLNKIYGELIEICNEICKRLSISKKDFEWGFFNNHYHKNAAGVYLSDNYPIPVISVTGLCDVEIDIDGVSVSAKIKKDDALKLDLEMLATSNPHFELYGVENFTNDFYTDGISLTEAKKLIFQSQENEIAITVYLQNNFHSEYLQNKLYTKKILETVDFLEKRGFYY